MRRLIALRTLYTLLVGLTCAAMAFGLRLILRVDGLTPVSWVVLALFAVLCLWVAASFWVVVFGMWIRWRHLPAHDELAVPSGVERASGRVAIVMPIYNEDTRRCFAGLRAMRESLLQTTPGGRFDFFVLSDSTEPERWRAEERAWSALEFIGPTDAPIYYRHSEHNIGRKSGNVADFCMRWGGRYDYLIVLDADSLMDAATLRQLVGLMDANPRAALIQAPPRIVGARTVFSRMQQFSASVYAPAILAGVAAVYGPAGNYWGHNAILRLSAFMAHCGLPTLPGRAPLGGEILSHDFVEAAMLRRAGWEVWMAPELEGSYEEVPPSVVDYLKRDRRWCQGNLQHLRLIFARDFSLSSRLHFAAGVMSYLASPLWLALLVTTVIDAVQHQDAGRVFYSGRYPILPWPVPHTLEFLALLLLSTGMLLGPKLIGMIDVLLDRVRRRAHGGVWRLGLGVMIETTHSALLAPMFMITHTGFLLAILVGRNSGWSNQQRDDRRLDLPSAARQFWLHTVIGAGAAIVLFRCTPDLLGWFAPLIAGLLFSIPIAIATSSARLGDLARRRGLFLVPSESCGLALLARARAMQGTSLPHELTPDALLTVSAVTMIQ
jgi:membrane glycosyltransferase